MEAARRKPLSLQFLNPDKGSLLGTDASDFPVSAVPQQVQEDGSHVIVPFCSRVLAAGQRRTWTQGEKEAYAILCALHKFARAHWTPGTDGMHLPSVACNAGTRSVWTHSRVQPLTAPDGTRRWQILT